MKKMFSTMAAAALCALAFTPAYAATNITENVTLTEDADWSDQGTVTIADGVTIDLNGYALKVAAINGAGSIVDSFADYERLVSLESDTSRGYIDLGYKHNAGTKVDFHVQFPALPAKGGYFAYYGARNSVGSLGQSDAHFGGWLHNDNGTTRFRSSFTSSAANYTGLKVETDTDYYLHFDKSGACTVTLADGTVHTIGTGNGNNTELDGTDYLFGFNQKQNMAGYPWQVPYDTSLRVFYFKAYSGDTLIRDMVPVKRKSDGHLGMWDFANSRFYPTQQYCNKGTFTAGATVSEGGLQIATTGGAASDFSALTIGSGVALVFSGECTLAADLDATMFASVEVISGAVLDLAGHNLTVNAVTGAGTITDTAGTALSGYDRLEFIKSTGTQYIDTGYLHDNTTKVDMRIQFDSVSPQWQSFYGARNSKGDTERGFSMWLNYAKFRRAFGETAANIDSHTVTTSTIYDIHLEKSGACTATPVGGEAIVLGTGKQGASLVYNNIGYTDYLFAINQYGDVNGRTIWSAAFATRAKLYSCKMYHGTTLARDFVPVKRGDVLGLLDLAQGVFYTNAGSGKFEPGTVVATTPGGELRIAVAEGNTVEISETALTGALKLVKTGEGTLVMSKASQGYAGGTEVQGGTLKGGAAALVFGAEGTEVAVDSSGNVELNGNANLAAYGWTVADGGTIVNGGAAIASSLAVSGVFSPVVTTGDFAATLSDGATLDFTKWTGEFPVASPAIMFVSGANITLKLEPATTALAALAKSKDAETGKPNGYLLSWGAIPTDVTFSPDAATRARFRVVPDENGLRVSFKGGSCIIIK